MRDGYYGICNGLELLPNLTQAVLSAEYMFRGQGADGVMPVVVTPTGSSVMGTQCQPTQPGCQDLDDGPFAVKMASCLANATASMPGFGLDFVKRWAAALRRGMDAVPRASNGLVNSPQGAHLVGYGFQDSILSTGPLM